MAVAELKVLQKLNEYEFGVSIRALRQGENRNKWSYQNLERYYKTFAGRPILIAYVNGQIGSGHNMQEKRDASGKPYYSFMDGTSERIVGTISEDPKDISLVEENGEQWIIAKGKLFTFYAPELVAEIVERGSYEVSAETEVLESHMEGDVDVFTNWVALGLTILGDGVAPAVPGANIKQLQALESEFEAIKLRAASYRAAEEEPGEDEDEDDTEEKEEDGVVDVDDPDEPDDSDEEDEPDDPDDIDDETDDLGDDDEDSDGDETKKPQNKSNEKGGKLLKVFHKREIAEFAKNFSDKFKGYTVLSVGQDDEGIRFCLMSEDGAPAVYTMESTDEMFDERKIQKMNASVAYKFGEEQIEIDVCDYTDTLGAKLTKVNSELESTSAELRTAQETIETMKAAELKRRVSAAKAAAKATLEKFNANRDDKVDVAILECINEAIDNGDYAECVDGEGEWCGEEAVCKEVLAKCAEKVMEYDKAQVARNSSQYIWDEAKGAAHDGEGVDSLFAMWDAMKI